MSLGCMEQYWIRYKCVSQCSTDANTCLEERKQERAFCREDTECRRYNAWRSKLRCFNASASSELHGKSEDIWDDFQRCIAHSKNCTEGRRCREFAKIVCTELKDKYHLQCPGKEPELLPARERKIMYNCTLLKRATNRCKQIACSQGRCLYLGTFLKLD